MLRSPKYYLADFNLPPPTEPSAPPSESPEEAGPDYIELPLAPLVVEATQAERQAEREAERDDIYARAMEAARRNCDLRLEAERARHAEQLEQARAKWRAEESASLAASMERALNEAIASIKESVAQILEPLLDERIAQRVADDFARCAKTALGDASDPALEVAGPADLLNALAPALEAAGIAARLTPSADVEAMARIDATSLSTQLARFMTKRDAG